MKQKVQRILAVSGLAIAIGTSGIILSASASAGNSAHSGYEKITKTKGFEKTAETKKHGARVITGTISDITIDSLTLTKGDRKYSVKISAETKITDRDGKTIVLSDLKDGNKIKVHGTISGTKTISAKKVRDLSL